MGLFDFLKKNRGATLQIADASAAEPGGHVTFGVYKQDDGRPKPVEWRVLAKEDGRILVISEYGLEARRVEEGPWAACGMRSWLNGEFLNTAFNDADRELIPEVTVKTENSARYGTEGGADTQDRVFLLSASEAETLLPSNGARRCVPTAYAVSKRAAVKDAPRVVIGYRNGGSKSVDIGTRTCLWFLRSPGYDPGRNAAVSYDGGIDAYGEYKLDYYTVIRPALWIRLLRDAEQ